MIHLKLFFIRKIKALSLKLRIYYFIEIFSFPLMSLLYLSKFSKWRANIPKLPFDDFYNGNVNYNDRFKLHKYVFDSEKLSGPIDYLEFGVGEGVSFKWWVNQNKNSESRFFGFDTFTGIPEDFGVIRKNDYNTKGSFPDVNNDQRCNFMSGMFQDSLLPFIKNMQWKNRKVIHMDADLYSSTWFVLASLFPYLNKNDIIMFDEYGVPMHEFKAFHEFIHAFKLKYKILGAVNNYLQIAIIVE